MKSMFLATLAASVCASTAVWENYSETITQTIKRVHYTCPCNGEESIVTSTKVPFSWPSNTHSIESSASYTSFTSTGSTATATTTSSTTVDSTITTTTTTTTVPTIAAGEPFAITPQLAPGGNLRKRAGSYVGFNGNQAVIVTDSSSSWAFKITPEGGLTTYNYGYSVGTSYTQQAAVITYFTEADGSPAQTNSWSIVDGALTYPGAGFCLSANNLMVMYYNNSPPNGCQLLQLAADSSSSSYNLNVTPVSTTTTTTTNSQTSSATTTTTVATPSSSDPSSPQTTSSTTTSSSTRRAGYSPISQSTTSTTSSSPYTTVSSTTTATPQPIAQNTTCLNSVPTGPCYTTVSTSQSTPQYESKCDMTWSLASSAWGSQSTFAQCMAQCDRTAGNATNPYACIGFAYNAATTRCGPNRGANCYLIAKDKAPVGTVGTSEDLLSSVWNLALLPEYWS